MNNTTDNAYAAFWRGYVLGKLLKATNSKDVEKYIVLADAIVDDDFMTLIQTKNFQMIQNEEQYQHCLTLIKNTQKLIEKGNAIISYNNSIGAENQQVEKLKKLQAANNFLLENVKEYEETINTIKL